MKRCFFLQMAIGVFAIAIALTGNDSCLANGGDSWGGGFGSRGLAGGSWGSRGGFGTPVRDFFAYRRPVRSLLSGIGNRLASRASNFGSRGWGGSGGFGSAGNRSTGYGSGGGSIGGGGSGGYSYYSAGSSGFSSASYVSAASPAHSQTISSFGAPAYAAPSTSYPISTFPSATLGTSCPDCNVGGFSTGAISSGPINSGPIISGPISYGNQIPPAIAPLSESSIIDSGAFGDSVLSTDQSIISSEQYYNQGSGTSGSATPSIEGSGSTRGFESPPTPEPSGDDTTTSIRRSDAILSVSVPLEAKVYVNGRLTRTDGELRKYVSRSLKNNHEYEFKVKAVIQRNGKDIALHENVSLRAGKSSFVSFDFDRPVLTQLTVKVPSNAKVKLCGNKTNRTGSVRSFKTRLEPGKVWDDYQIEVSYEVDGEVVKQNRTISIEAGQAYVVDFQAEKDLYVSK